MRAKHTALLLTAAFLLMPTLLRSQFPGGFGGGPPGGDGKSRMQMDPDQLFNFVAKGQEVIRVDQLDAFSKSMFDRFASRLGLTGNEITRDQFKSAMTRAREMAASGQLPGGMNFQGGPGGGSDPDRRTEDRFQRMDRDQDGVLSNDELPETLQMERDKYDTNHDGKIDLNEYKAYLAARFEGRGAENGRRPDAGGPNGRFDPAAPDEEERKRPTIVRAGNLPRDFPYAALDTDADSQIGLYEWKAAGSPISEFVKMDLNNDGFLTVEEYYGWRKQVQDELAKSGSQSGEFARGGRGPGGMMAMGPGGRGMGMTGGGPGFGMAGGGNFGGGRGTEMMMRGMGGDRSGFGGGPGFGMAGGGGFGGGRGMDLTTMRGPGGDRSGFGGGTGFGMGGGNWGSGMGTAGDRGFGRGPGGDRGSFGGGMTPPGSYNPGGGMTIPGAFSPQGGAFPQAGAFTPPGGMTPRGDRGPAMSGDRGFPGMGGDRGSGFGGDRGPRGRGGPGGFGGAPSGDGGDRGDRPPRKDRSR
jgi:Ca2+-binding EF-hand superfamily protein